MKHDAGRRRPAAAVLAGTILERDVVGVEWQPRGFSSQAARGLRRFADRARRGD